MHSATLLAFGDFPRPRLGALAICAEQAALELEVARDPARALDGGAGDVAAMVVDDSTAGAERFCVGARASSSLGQVPLLTLTSELSDLSFAAGYGMGSDDVLFRNASRGLVRRLRALRSAAQPHASPEPRGKALVVDPDPGRRVLVGRVLRSAGYQIAFAGDPAEAARGVLDAELVVRGAEQSPDTIHIEIEQARAAGCRAIWLCPARPGELGALRASLADLKGVAVTDAFAPPENLLFLANELRRGGGAPDHRSGPRLLYGTRVHFQGAGQDRSQETCGYSYNVSVGGLYVRTLAPPADSVVWLELTPPRSERSVRLEGNVRWRRPYGPNGSATVPPGFGVEITDASARDLETWRQGVEAFRTALG